MFAIICPGRPVQTPLHPLTPTTFIHPLPLPLNHIVVFLLPDTHLPETHAASVHIQFPDNQPFRLLGAISSSKPSAIFRVDAKGMQGQVMVGISIEEVGMVASQVTGAAGYGAVAGAGSGAGRVETVVLARRIIQNAFNFLSSFAGGGGSVEQEVVPLKAFRDWWVKFEKKVELDPGFLEREGED
ncbi:hypothetical protein B9Z19DRAFT_1054860 [Tuber borchii]|uniref:Uncharacterized protein n=1 Tax=Tuber borchii TaxID=42251 RepID=A0A2T6ZHQ0_TUBBO|nr:hypothetical protein B9Z19DRAFT_1054860 [Tuber borchii]